jgi:hypothetical protein
VFVKTRNKWKNKFTGALPPLEVPGKRNMKWTDRRDKIAETELVQ